jgi:hypothetical protein
MPHRSRGPISLQTFSLGDMLRCGVEIRRVAAGAESMEATARRIVAYLHDALREPATGRPSCVLARCFVTLRYGSLPPELQEAARGAAQEVPLSETTRCLVLLATAGDRPEWNDRRTSEGHRAIPLPSPEVVEQAPMISRMIRQMGVDLDALLEGADPHAEGAARTYDVFYVAEAEGSPYIPAQDEFVRPYGIRSVVGFGGLLQEELFFILLFSREPVPEDAAGRFRNIALDAGIPLMSHELREVFETSAGT